MSEAEPTSAAESDIAAFKAQKENEENQKLLEGVFADSFNNAVPGRDGDDQKRIAEGTEYLKHLEDLSKRNSAQYDGVNGSKLEYHQDQGSRPDSYDKDLMESAHAEALAENDARDNHDKLIEEKIQSDPRYRRVSNMALDIAARRNHIVSESDDEPALQGILKDKEDKLQELLVEYSNQGLDHEVLDYILDKAFAEANPGEQAAEQVAETVTGPEAGKGEHAFQIGQEVKVQRTSGEVQDGWKVTNSYTDAFGERSYQVENGEFRKNTVPEATLLSWQNEAGASGSEADPENPEGGDEPVDADPAEAEQPDSAAEEGEPQEEGEPVVLDDMSDIDTTGEKSKLSAKERLDLLRQKGLKGLKVLFSGPNTWMATWNTSRFMNHNRSNMTPEELEAYKKKRRVAYILGGAAIFVAGVITGELIMKGVMDASAAQAFGGHGGNVDPSSLPGAPRGSIDALHNGGNGGTATIEVPVVAPPVIEGNFNIAPGEGGIQLLQQLNVPNPTEEWQRIQGDLMNQFGGPGGSFYQPPGEMVRINDAPLPDNVKQEILRLLGRS